MARYNLTFAKRSYMIYTSHLDMQRLFKRVFKRADIALSYSQGYNPHPLMSFAQPLSLGYYSECELLEFKTKSDHSPSHIMDKLNQNMPEGLIILDCSRMTDSEKTLASRCYSAGYRILIPISKMAGDVSDNNSSESVASELVDRAGEYLKQNTVIALKRTKKHKEGVETDIKSKIRKFDFSVVDDNFVIETILDAGSDSNLSPELLFETFNAFTGLKVPRESVEISRTQLNCK